MDSRIKSSAVTLLDMSGIGWLTKPVYGGRGMILTLHRVILPDAVSVTPGSALTTSQLESALQFIRRKGWDLLALRDVPERLRSRRRGRFFVCITLDDGFADNLLLAAPIFRKYEAPYSVFVVTGVADRTVVPFFGVIDELLLSVSNIELRHPARGLLSFDCDTLQQKRNVAATLRGIGWKDPAAMTSALEEYCATRGLSLRQLTDKLMLSWEQVRSLAKDRLATIGSHTVTHAQLAMRSSDEATQEMSLSRDRLRAELGCPVEEIAYPFGSVPGCCGPREFHLARELGYQRGVTTQRWNLFPEHERSLLSLPRVGFSIAHSPNHHFLRLSAYGTWNLISRVGKGE